MSYSVFRIQGIKTTGDLKGLKKHNVDRVSRTNEEIDRKKSKDNIILVECSNYNQSFNEIVAPMKEEHTNRMKTMRADRVKTFDQSINSSKNDVACEMIFTSDDKFFDGMSNDDIKRWAEKSLDFVTKDIGIEKKNILHAIVHVDEKTPHLHVVAVPLVNTYNKKQQRDVWSISRRQYINGKVQLSSMQDIYNQKMNESGYKLERGEKGTGKEHIDTNDYKRDLKLENKNLIRDNKRLLEDNKRLIEENGELKQGISSDYLEYWDINRKLGKKVNELEDKFERVKDVLNIAKEIVGKNELLEKAQNKLDEIDKGTYKKNIKDYFQEI